MTIHTGNKPFRCPECPKTFGSRFEMKTHCNYIHRGIKEHECQVCNKMFTLRSNLKVHMRKHTGEKPYQCEVCNKRFGQRGHLQYHMRKHEGKHYLFHNKFNFFNFFRIFDLWNSSFQLFSISNSITELITRSNIFSKVVGVVNWMKGIWLRSRDFWITLFLPHIFLSTGLPRSNLRFFQFSLFFLF